jgi:hypothetical protein
VARRPSVKAQRSGVSEDQKAGGSSPSGRTTEDEVPGQLHYPNSFGPAAIAGIGCLHPTMESRCIPIMPDRKVRGEGERWVRFQVEEEAGV